MKYGSYSLSGNNGNVFYWTWLICVCVGYPAWPMSKMMAAPFLKLRRVTKEYISANQKFKTVTSLF